MAITYVGAASAASDSVSLPSFQEGDIAIVLALRVSSSTIPTVPAGWETVNSTSLSGIGDVVGIRRLQTGDTTTGTWTNAERIGVAIYRGALFPQDGSSIGVSVSAGTTISISVSSSDYSSSLQVALALTDATTNDADDMTVTGWTNRTAGGNGYFGVADSPSGTAGGTYTQSATTRHGRATVGLRLAGGAPQVVDADTKSGSVTSNSSSWTLTYPTNVKAGDLLLAFMAADAGPVPTTWPSGWSNFDNGIGSGAVSLIAAKKIATGSEAGTFNVTLNAAEQGAWRVMRIVGWFGTDISSWSWIDDGASVITTALTGTSATPDPQPATSPQGLSEDFLWFAVMAADTSRTVSDWPDSTTDNGSLVSGGAGGATLAWSRRELNAAEWNPTTFTISTSDDWAVLTIGIRPAFEVSKLVAASADDAHWYGGATISTNATQGYVGDFSATIYDSTAGFRFTGIAIPQGATIDSAYLLLNLNGATSSFSATIDGHDADDAAAFSTYGDATGRAHTTASVSWSLPTTARIESSPDISAIIEEIVGRAGWASGNDIVLFLNNPTAGGWSGSQAYVQLVMFDASAAPAQLVINWTAGAGGTQYSQGLTASLSFTGATVKQGGKALPASLSFTGAISKAISTARTASLSFTGAIAKQASKSFAGAITPGGALASARVFLRDLTASLGFSGAITKRAGKTLTASLTPAGTLSRSISRALSATVDFSTAFVADFIGGGTEYTKDLTAALSFAAGLSRVATRKVAPNAATLGFSAALATASVVQKFLTATLDFSGTMVKQANRPLAAALSFTTTIVKVTSRILAASITPGGQLDTLKTFLRSFSASLGLDGSLLKEARKPLTASVGFAGGLVKSTSRSIAASLGLDGSLVKMTTRSLSASLTPSGALATLRQIVLDLTASLGFSGSLSRSTARSLAASLGLDGALLKQANKAFSGTVDFSGSLASLKAFFREFSATLDFSGNLTRVGSFVRSFAASLSPTTAFVRAATRTIPGGASVSFNASLSTIRVFLRNLTATLTFDGALTKSTSRAFSAVLDFAGNLASQFQGGANQFFESFTASLTFSGGLVKSTGKSLQASLSSSGALIKSTSRQIEAALTLSASVARRTVRALSAGLSFTGALSTASVIVRAFSAALSFTGSLASASTFARSFAAALSFAAQVGRATTRQIPANLSFEGQVSKLTARALVGALTLSGSLSRMTARFLAGAVTFTGSIASQVLTGGQRVLIAAGRVTVGLSARASTQVVARASSAFRVAGRSAASLASRFRIGKE